MLVEHCCVCLQFVLTVGTVRLSYVEAQSGSRGRRLDLWDWYESFSAWALRERGCGVDFSRCETVLVSCLLCSSSSLAAASLSSSLRGLLNLSGGVSLFGQREEKCVSWPQYLQRIFLPWTRTVMSGVVRLSPLTGFSKRMVWVMFSSDAPTQHVHRLGLPVSCLSPETFVRLAFDKIYLRW